jgi:two-component system response regulator FixJ
MRDDDSPARGGVVHVIDDDEAVRQAVAILLRSGTAAVETHASALRFLEALPSLREDSIRCVLTDVRMPDLDGLELLHRLKARGFRRPVIVMTAHGDVSMAVQAMKSGAADFIEKPFHARDLLASIQALSRRPPSSPARDASAAARLASLSQREREVLGHLLAGMPNKQIARELGLSPRTVEAHRARLMERLGVGSLAEAVRIAVEAELEKEPAASRQAATDAGRQDP